MNEPGPSYNRVDYSIRPNKHAERRLLLAWLQQLSSELAIATFRYIGFGSMWFSDFVLVHKLIGIRDMISIEYPGDGATRAEFNRPLACITVCPGVSTEVLSALDWSTVPVIAWLDYDKGLDSQFLADAEVFCARAVARSILIVTLNAHAGQIRGRKDADDSALNERQALESLVGDVAPRPLGKGDFSQKRFPHLMTEIIFNQLERAARESGRSERPIPVASLTYSDGAPMATAVAIIGGDDEERLIAQYLSSEDWPLLNGRGLSTIELPALTGKEKLTLDRLLPCASPLDREDLARDFKLPLKQDQVLAYQQLYRFYPVYKEVQ